MFEIRTITADDADLFRRRLSRGFGSDVDEDEWAAERFTAPVLPDAWHNCGKQNFYANILAYHEASPVGPDQLDPVQFVKEYERCKTERGAA